MCSRMALISDRRAAIMSPKPLLAGLELSSALPPPRVALRVLLLDTLLFLAACSLRRQELCLMHVLPLDSASESEAVGLPELLELLVEVPWALLRLRVLLL